MNSNLLLLNRINRLCLFPEIIIIIIIIVIIIAAMTYNQVHYFRINHLAG